MSKTEFVYLSAKYCIEFNGEFYWIPKHDLGGTLLLPVTMETQ